MDKRLITFIAISAGILLGWNIFFPPPRKEAPVVADGGGLSADADGGTAPAVAPIAAAPLAAPDAAKPGDPAARRPEQLTAIDVPGHYHAQLTSYGAALHDFELQDPAYREVQKKGDVPIDLVASKEAPYPFDVTFPSSGFNLPANADFQLVGDETGNERRFRYVSGNVTIEKHYTFDPKGYEVKLEVTVENRGDKAVPAQLELALSGWQDPDVQGGFLHRAAVETEGVCVGKSTERANLSTLLKGSIEVKEDVRVMAIDRKWFALGVAMTPTAGSVCRVEGKQGGRITATLSYPQQSIAANARQTWTFVGYIGPKVIKQLKSVTLPGGAPAHMDDVITYRIWGLTQFFEAPMLWVLKKLHEVVSNWGLCIVLLTLLLKLLTWWPTAQSMKSAQAMAKLKPEMDKLKEKYSDDKTKMNQEVMLLYQKHKINPLGGCLPVLIQMPIYISLYSMLGNAVELYRQPLGFWIHDLTAPDPFFILPLATGAVMFLQQKLSPTPPDPQQKTMMTIMPIMFTGMSMFLPSGLALYIMTNTVFSLIQQRISAPKATQAHSIVTQ